MAIGPCRALKTNQWLGSGAARANGDESCQNGRGIWLCKRPFHHRILRFTSPEATTEYYSAMAWQGTQYSFPYLREPTLR